MDSRTRFLKALEKARSGDAKKSFTVKTARGGAEVEMDIAEADRLGVLARETRASRRTPPSDEKAVVSQADEIIRRVTYLQESLALIELDRRRRRAVLRSANPRVEGDSLRYYEMVLDGGRSATLKRYRYSKGARGRQAEDTNLSTETASRLAGDLLDLFRSR